MLAQERADRVLLQNERLPNVPLKKIWNASIPLRIGFFAWRVYHGRLQTVDNPNVRGMRLHNICSMCEKSEDSVDHILVTCRWTKKVWDFFLPLFKRGWTCPSNAKDALCEDFVNGRPSFS